MKIENNILKHYLKNVYFITGTAYAGKSTTVRILADWKDFVLRSPEEYERWVFSVERKRRYAFATVYER